MLALLLMLLFQPVAAQTGCAPYREAITVDFQTRQPRPTLNNTLNVTSLQNLMRGKGTPPAGGGHADALGVTYSTPEFDIEASTRIVGGDRRPACVYLTKVRVEFGFRDMDVYVASEYPSGTCEYKAILDHENQHVAINTQALRTHAPRLRLALERILGEEQPVRTNDPNRVTQQILDRISRRMDEYLRAFYAEMDSRNGALDTASNYEAIGNICRDWDRGNVWPQTR
jgi:hypothetical protein